MRDRGDASLTNCKRHCNCPKYGSGIPPQCLADRRRMFVSVGTGDSFGDGRSLGSCWRRNCRLHAAENLNRYVSLVEVRRICDLKFYSRNGIKRFKSYERHSTTLIAPLFREECLTQSHREGRTHEIENADNFPTAFTGIMAYLYASLSLGRGRSLIFLPQRVLSGSILVTTVVSSW